MVRNVLALLWGNLRGTDIHPAVQLHRVRVHHLAIEFRRQPDAEIGLSGSSRPHNRHGIGHASTPFRCAAHLPLCGPVPLVATVTSGPTPRRDRRPRRAHRSTTVRHSTVRYRWVATPAPARSPDRWTPAPPPAPSRALAAQGRPRSRVLAPPGCRTPRHGRRALRAIGHPGGSSHHRRPTGRAPLLSGPAGTRGRYMSPDHRRPPRAPPEPCSRPPVRATNRPATPAPAGAPTAVNRTGVTRRPRARRKRQHHNHATSHATDYRNFPLSGPVPPPPSRPTPR